MKRFEVGKTYKINTVLFNDEDGYTVVKRAEKSITLHDNFYGEDIKKKLYTDEYGEYFVIDREYRVYAN